MVGYKTEMQIYMFTLIMCTRHSHCLLYKPYFTNIVPDKPLKVEYRLQTIHMNDQIIKHNET